MTATSCPFSRPKMRNVCTEAKRAKRKQPFRYLLLDQPTMRLRNANHAFYVCHLLPMSWPCLLPMSWPRTLPKDPRLFAKEHRPAHSIVVLGHQARRAAVQHVARSPDELARGLMTLLFLISGISGDARDGCILGGGSARISA